MVKHIVFWKLREQAQGRAAAQNAVLLKERLEALRGEVPGLIHLEVGMDISRTDASADVALYSEFEDMAALEVYQAHPAHQTVVAFANEVREDRLVVDYEL